MFEMRSPTVCMYVCSKIISLQLEQVKTMSRPNQDQDSMETTRPRQDQESGDHGAETRARQSNDCMTDDDQGISCLSSRKPTIFLTQET